MLTKALLNICIGPSRALKLICPLAATIVVLIPARTTVEMNICIEYRKMKLQPYVSQRAGMNIQGSTQRSAYGVLLYIQSFIDPMISVN